MPARKNPRSESAERMNEIIREADAGLARVQKQAPLVDRVHAYLAARVEHNGFGRDFTMSMQPRRAGR